MEKEFTALVTGHQGIILKVCRMYCRDPDDAGDLFQEIVLQLWKGYAGGVLSVVLVTGMRIFITRRYNRRIRELEQYLSEFDEK